jgi:uncharacterized Zn finger protein (UPF0148 family)
MAQGVRCPACGTELHLELATGELVEPEHEHERRRREWDDAVTTAELREAQHGMEE